MNENLVSSGDRKRNQLFDLYARNIRAVKEHPKITLEPDYDDICVCPICMKFFPREALSVSEEYVDYLTLEDVPPVALGGNVRTLTCKICNNTAGSQLESHLVNKLNFEETIQGLNKTSVDVTFRPGEDAQLAATFHNKGSGVNYIQVHPERSHPVHVNQFQTMVNSGELGEFSLEFRGKYRQHRPEVALLRIAYLLAHSTFGFAFLINFNLQLIREQIQSPQERILEHSGIFSTDYSDDMLGINIVTKPKELQSFLIVFELKTLNRTTRHGVLLPGPTAPGLNIYRWLSKLPEDKRVTEIRGINIPDGDYLQKPILAFASHAFWNEFTNQ